MKKLIGLLAVLCWIGLPAGAVDHGVLDFEDDAILSRIRTVGGGRATLSDRRHLGGRKALRWDFVAGSTLEIDFPPWYLTDAEATREYGAEARSILTLSIYSEEKLPESAVTVGFGRRGRPEPDCHFPFLLNFTGWRHGWVVYSRDMEGAPHKEMNLIRFTAPAGAAAGTLYFDNLIPSSLTYERYQEGDLQLPMVRAQVPPGENELPPMRVLHLKAPQAPPPTPEQIAAWRRMEQKVTTHFAGPPINAVSRRRYLDTLRQRLEDYQLVRHEDGRVTGKPLLYGVLRRQYDYVPDRESRLAEFIPLTEYGKAMQLAARLHFHSSEPEMRRELEALYLLLLDHLVDQGFAYGSSMGSMALLGYGAREAFDSFLIMRELLVRQGRTREIALIGFWQNAINTYLDESLWPTPNTGYFNLQANSTLTSLLLLDDVPEKAVYFDAFSRFVSRNLAWETPGWMGGFKPDGCVFHHWGHYPSYAFSAFAGAARLCYALADSPWAVSEKGRRNLARAFHAASLYGNPYAALPLEGRVPFRRINVANQSANIRLLALAGDPEMASLAVALNPDFRRDFPDAAALPPPQGHWSFNYGGFGIHRHGDKMVTLKTFNRYVWGQEIYHDSNRYGRYLSYGGLYILGRGDLEEEGFAESGWDWNRIPGATALYRPWEELDAPVRRAEMRTMPDNRINGSSHLLNEYGSFGSIITEPETPSYDPAFRAVKSVFCFGPRLIALGSDIAADSPHPVETTLFQFSTGREQNRFGCFNSAEAAAGDGEVAATGPAYAVDFRGIGYFVFSESTVRFRRGGQTTPRHSDRQPSAGHFVTARIDHGVRPRQAGYEFLVHLDLPQADVPAFAAQLQRNKPYRVLRRDARAHALHDHASGVTAAVAFEPLDRPLGLLEETSAPGYVMYRKNSDGTLNFSFNTPDLAGFVPMGRSDLELSEMDAGQENLDRVLRVTLSGFWQCAELPPGVTLETKGNSTGITGVFRHGIPYQLTLRPVAE